MRWKLGRHTGSLGAGEQLGALGGRERSQVVHGDKCLATWLESDRRQDEVIAK